ncbi:MAG: polyprenyl synthetase family protein [Stappiaceae bacterium]
MTSLPDRFLENLTEVAGAVESCLDGLLSQNSLADEIVRPARLLEAMRYGALGGGKRLRPFLFVQAAALFDGDPDRALRAACALECIHCYSLIHDDLPAMDDDDVRRGRSTVHKAFDEATAILAGDGLLTYAFDIMANEQTHPDPEIRMQLTSGLARASGMGGMAGGQMLDLDAEGHQHNDETIRLMQAMKTGALIRFGCEGGAIFSGASADDIDSLRRFGQTIGLAFQLADDLLDVEGEATVIGKATGKDSERGKATLVSLNGVDWTRKTLRSLVQQAEEILSPYGDRADLLCQTARYIADRRS